MENSAEADKWQVYSTSQECLLEEVGGRGGKIKALILLPTFEHWPW